MDPFVVSMERRRVQELTCLYCGAVVERHQCHDHWRECPAHPARAEIERLRAEVERLRKAFRLAIGLARGIQELEAAEAARNLNETQKEK